jgi:hypothetical protein
MYLLSAYLADWILSFTYHEDDTHGYEPEHLYLLLVLRIRDIYSGYGFFLSLIPGSEFFPSRIPNLHQRMFTPDHDFYPSRILDPVVKKAPDPDPESGSATL